MLAPLVPDDAIPGLAGRIDAAEMFEVLRCARWTGSVMNEADVDAAAAGFLKRLTDLGLVDVGLTDGRPYVWTINHNGERVVAHLEAELSRRMEAAQEEDDRERASRTRWLA